MKSLHVVSIASVVLLLATACDSERRLASRESAPTPPSDPSKLTHVESPGDGAESDTASKPPKSSAHLAAEAQGRKAADIVNTHSTAIVTTYGPQPGCPQGQFVLIDRGASKAELESAGLTANQKQTVLEAFDALAGKTVLAKGDRREGSASAPGASKATPCARLRRLQRMPFPRSAFHRWPYWKLWIRVEPGPTLVVNLDELRAAQWTPVASSDGIRRTRESAEIEMDLADATAELIRGHVFGE